MSTIGWLFGLAGKLLRKVLPPRLDGPIHTFIPPETKSVTYYQLHRCTKCLTFVEKRAAYTSPRCKERPAKVIIDA